MSYAPQPPLQPQRIGHADRETALGSLRDHYAEGRLDHEDFDERSSAVLASRTAADLQPLFADLPGGCPVADPHTRPSRATAPPPWAGAPYVPGVRADGRVRRAWDGLPLWVQVLLVVVAAGLVLANLPLVILAGVVWFVLARHGAARRPPWAHRHHRAGSQ